MRRNPFSDPVFDDIGIFSTAVSLASGLAVAKHYRLHAFYDLHRKFVAPDRGPEAEKCFGQNPLPKGEGFTRHLL